MGVAEDELANALERLQNTPGKKVEEVPDLKLIERLGSITPPPFLATCTRNSDSATSTAKRPRPNRQEPGGSEVLDEPCDPTPVNDVIVTAEENGNNQPAQDGGHNEAPPPNLHSSHHIWPR
ncbi:hypothetical protein ACROYT_G021837 [Oculina patagonica]